MTVSRPLRIAVIGTRGFPGVQGGVETHCQALFPRIAGFGHKVVIFGRSSYLGRTRPYHFEGLQVVPLPCPRSRRWETLVHTFLAVLLCLCYRPHIVHIHAVGPALLTPLARLLGFKVVFTHHGPDYERQKWGRIARTALQWGEKMGCRFANRIIVISRPIQQLVEEKHRRSDSRIIFNGVDLPSALTPKTIDNHLSAFGLKKGKYVLALGRLVPEKGFHDLIDAIAGLSDVKLVIAGDADHPTPYSTMLYQRAEEVGVVMTGFVNGELLQSLLSGAGLFVLPSYHEGLPIALLEAMSHGLNVLVSDIPANRAVELPHRHYVPAGDVEALREAIRTHLVHPPRTDGFVDIVRERYDWDAIAEQTQEVYRSLAPRRWLRSGKAVQAEAAMTR